MAGITTHVLDNLIGQPGVGMRIDFSVREEGRWKLLKTVTTNGDGRTDAPLLPAAESRAGEYEIAFHLGDYYAARHRLAPEALFVDRVVPLRFVLFDTSQHFHVPMLCTPWSCSTYRGS